jgi:hypothetical protein
MHGWAPDAALSAVGGLRQLYESDEARGLAVPPSAAELLAERQIILKWSQTRPLGPPTAG